MRRSSITRAPHSTSYNTYLPLRRIRGLAFGNLKTLSEMGKEESESMQYISRIEADIPHIRRSVVGARVALEQKTGLRK